MSSYLCYAHIGCDECGVPLNPGYAWAAQKYCESQYQAGIGIKASALAGPICDQFPQIPVGLPGTNGAPWVDPNNPLSEGFFGVIFHEFTVKDPSELTQSRRSALAASGCRIEGRRVVTMRVEPVGVSKAATQWGFEWVKRMLHSHHRCCSQNVEVWRHCCETDILNEDGNVIRTETGRRILTDTRDYLVSCPTDQSNKRTRCGTVVDIVFTAGPEIREPDGEVCADAEYCGPICVECPPTTELVDRTVSRAKKQCNVDLKAAVGGTLILCRVDFDVATFDPDECYVKVRNLIPAEDSEQCKPAHVDLIVDDNGDVEIVPLHPDAFYPVPAELDCACGWVVNSVTRPNPNPDFDCPQCFVNGENLFWARECGLVVGADGFIDMSVATQEQLEHFGICTGSFTAQQVHFGEVTLLTEDEAGSPYTGMYSTAGGSGGGGGSCSVSPDWAGTLGHFGANGSGPQGVPVTMNWTNTGPIDVYGNSANDSPATNGTQTGYVLPDFVPGGGPSTPTDGYLAFVPVSVSGADTVTLDFTGLTATPNISLIDSAGNPKPVLSATSPTGIVTNANNIVSVVGSAVFDPFDVSITWDVTGATGPCWIRWDRWGEDTNANSASMTCAGGADTGTGGAETPSSSTTGTLPYTPSSAKPLTRITEGCGVDLPPVCSPTVTVQPSGTGPCITLTRDLTDLTSLIFTPDADLLANDLSTVVFAFGPCRVAIESCDAVIPPNPEILGSLTSGLAVGDGWLAGQGWPGESDASEYTITQVDGVPNVDTPVVTVEQVEVPIVTEGCAPPCGDPADIRIKEARSSCWPECLPKQELWLAKVTGLSASTEYRPKWEICASDDEDICWVTSVVTGDIGLAPDTTVPETLLPYFCGAEGNRSRINQIPAGGKFTVDESGLPCVTCSTGRTNGLDGWVDSSQGPWGNDLICDVTEAYLLLSVPCGTEFASPPTLCLEPITR